MKVLNGLSTGIKETGAPPPPAPQPAQERARAYPIRYEDGPWAYPWPPPQDPGRCEDCGRPLPPELPGWKCATCSIRTFEAKGWPVSAWLRALAQREAEGEPAADR
jgi:hypothetical protein